MNIHNSYTMESKTPKYTLRLPEVTAANRLRTDVMRSITTGEPLYGRAIARDDTIAQKLNLAAPAAPATMDQQQRRRVPGFGIATVTRTHFSVEWNQTFVDCVNEHGKTASFDKTMFELFPTV